jgi:metal-responsive CopG/Arc/MetJ family transcriptional regulator
MKHHIGLTIDAKLLKEIEELRGREKRSTFIEHLIKLGLKAYIKNENMETFEMRKVGSFSKV